MHSSADYGPLRAPRKLLILSATKGRIFGHQIASVGSCEGSLARLAPASSVTSFSSPTVLRAAIGVRAHLGPVLNGLALKALMIHNTHIKDLPIRRWGGVNFARM